MKFKKECLYCGKEFEDYKSHIKRRRFCCLTCFNKWHNSNGKKLGFKKGHPRYKNSGEFNSEKTKGEKNVNWNGGISKIKKTKRQYEMFSIEYKQWRSKVFERDNWTCQTCGKRSKSGEGIILNAHHIKKWNDYPELRLDINNGVTLCTECHLLTHTKNKKNARNTNVREVS